MNVVDPSVEGFGTLISTRVLMEDREKECDCVRVWKKDCVSDCGMKSEETQACCVKM